MNEIEINQLPISDEFGLCIRKLRRISPDHTKKRQLEIKNCNHLFVKIKNGEEFFGCHSTDYYKGANEVECVHCGLTNRFKKIEDLLNNEYEKFPLNLRSPIEYNKKTIESDMFDEIFKNSYVRDRKSFNNQDLKLLSNECLLTYHPGLLYHLALQINPTGNKEDLFQIMKQLHLLETFQEKIRLQTEEQAKRLINRYFMSKPNCLILKKEN